MMRSLLVAQSLGEYGNGSGLAAQFASAVQTGAACLELSLREDRQLWIVSALDAGNHPLSARYAAIQARYVGTANHMSSVSAVLQQAVKRGGQ